MLIGNNQFSNYTLFVQKKKKKKKGLYFLSLYFKPLNLDVLSNLTLVKLVIENTNLFFRKHGKTRGKET